MDGYEFNSSEKAEASELQRMIAIEQQKAQFQAQVTFPPTGAVIVLPHFTWGGNMDTFPAFW